MFKVFFAAALFFVLLDLMAVLSVVHGVSSVALGTGSGSLPGISSTFLHLVGSWRSSANSMTQIISSAG